MTVRSDGQPDAPAAARRGGSPAGQGRGRAVLGGPRLVVGVLVVVAVLATSAAQAVDPGVAAAARFDQIYAGFQAWFLGEHDERGVAWTHWRIQIGAEGALGSSRETDYVRVGQGAARATMTGQRNTEPGFSLDVLHEAGSDVDLVLVGDVFRRPAGPRAAGPRGPLVTTPWIARPAKGQDRWSPCVVSATLLFCDIDRAFARSRAALPGLPRWVVDNPDGTRTARTAVRLVDLLALGDADPLDDRQLAQVAPLFDRLVPLSITENGGGQFLRAELGGRLRAPGLIVEIDDGLEFHGGAVASDLPPGPRNRDEVTAMNEVDYIRFAAAVSQRTRTTS